ncbi:DHA2 family efflux MFS transporter permease subunit [Kineosporia mesophila]|uniref:DHA2 family efflux MFS transporter permease subunit n=1 Tax=Kineosporia mesophila TaxID=566012 RepID=A0ABP7AUL5_9ACTN|nr:MDR family MFS transporter [Kineosporia mesophila]MCD5352370.1 multidrug efflux MFS transporter [Kineosporia mesophila]
MSPPEPFSPALKRLILVTTLGSFMAFLDSTIVNVALESLTVDLHADLATIQWVLTGYLLAMAAVIPVSGWVSTRFGAVQTYVVALAAFTVASLICGLAGSVEMLVAGRVLQGLAGGLLMPVGSMMMLRATGPGQIARVMGVAGVPTVMAPVFGPTVGGLIIEHAGWEWIFFLNLPIGLLTLILAVRLLAFDARGEAGPPDLAGLVLIIGGTVGLTYGLAEIGSAGGLHARSVGALTIGAVMLVAFVAHQLIVPKPLLDLRLFRNPRYAVASLANFCLGAAIFGAIILLPLYFQLVRGEDAVATGLLLMPQGAGVALGMIVGAGLTDRIGSGWTGVSGSLLSLVATLPFTAIGVGTSYVLLDSLMVVRGLGVGFCAVAVSAAAFRAIDASRIPDATVQNNVLQRLGGSAATAAFAVILQHQLESATSSQAVADGFGTAFWWVVAISAGSGLPLLWLIPAERRAARPPEDQTLTPSAASSS